MNIRKLNFASLELFLAVASNGSFTKAAEALGVSKSYVSQIVKTLEDGLGVDLFIRTTRSLSLTYEGELFLSQCEKVIYEFHNTKDLVDSFHNELTGKLRISCNRLLAEKVLLPILIIYRNKFPKVVLDVVIEERVPNFHDEQLDVVFGANWQPPEDIIARKIATTEYVLCASANYISEKGYPKNLTEISDYNFIPHSGRQRTIVGMSSENSSVEIFSDISANNTSFVKECVRNGLGIALFHDYVVQKELDGGEFVKLLSEEFGQKQGLYIYYQKNRFVQPKVKEFVKIVLENVSFDAI